MGQYRRQKYRVRERDYDGRVVSKAFSDRLDAAEYQLVIRRRRERFKAGLEIIPEPLTFREWVGRWFERRKLLRPPSTWKADQYKLERVWLPALSDRKLATIFPSDITRILEGLLAAGCSPATRNRHRALLHRIFEEARKEFPPLVTINPIHSIPALPECWREREIETLSEPDMRAYCDAAWRVAGESAWGIVATILCWSGIRIGEALALRWRDVAESEINVCRTLEISTGLIRQRTKGKGSYSALFLPPVASAIARHGRRRPDELVANGLDYWLARKLHKRTLRTAGLSRKITIHKLRHSFARLAFRTGLRRDDIRDVLGHRSTTTTDRYAPRDIQPAREAAKCLKLGENQPLHICVDECEDA